MIENEEKIKRSRKWVLALMVIIIATVAAFVPPLLSTWVFKDTSRVVILTGTEWVSVITLVTGAYIGGNVWQRKVEIENGKTKENAEA